MWVIGVKRGVVDPFEEGVVGVSSAGVALGVSVVTLGPDGGSVLDGGEEHRAGLADRLVAAVELAWAAAVAVAEQAFGRFVAQGAHAWF